MPISDILAVIAATVGAGLMGIISRKWFISGDDKWMIALAINWLLLTVLPMLVFFLF